MELIRKFQSLSLQAVIGMLEDFINEGITDKQPEKRCGGSCRCGKGDDCCKVKGRSSGGCGGNCHCAKSGAH